MSPIPGCRPLLHMPPLRCGQQCFVGPLKHAYAVEYSGVSSMESDLEKRRLVVAIDNQLCWSCRVVTGYCTASSQTGSGKTVAR